MDRVQTLINIRNLLLDVETKGQSSLIIADSIRALTKVIEDMQQDEIVAEE